MRTISCCFLFLLAWVPTTASLPATAEARAVRDAQSRLGRGVWSRLLEIENKGDTSVYPKLTYAMVFAFNGMLWIYTPYDGTQSLSLYANRLERDQADVRPLLREIHPGFAGFAELPEKDAPDALAEDDLPNGCFIESLASARALEATGQRVLKAGILLYYARGRSMQGHAVLAYETEGGVFIDDMARPRPERVGGKWSDRPIDLARRHEPSLRKTLLDAKFIPMSIDPKEAPVFALAQKSVTPGLNG